MTKEDLGALMRFAEPMGSLMAGMGGPGAQQKMNTSMNRVNKFPGFPVQRVRGSGPDAEVETLKKIDRRTLPAALFAIPEGFTREDPMAGRPGGPGGPGRPGGRPPRAP